MYRRIVKNGTPFIIFLISFFLSLPGPSGAYGLDSIILLGRGDGWQDFVQKDNLMLRPGKWGTWDLFLADNEYLPDPETDLLLHFNRRPLLDAAGNYRVLKDNVLLSEQFNRKGAAGGGFSGPQKGLDLMPGRNALFAERNWWGDFSIEFWLYPALLNDGESVFSWVGSRWRQDKIIPQSVLCTIQNRRLIWEFENFFIPVGDGESFINLKGLTPLVPKSWHHHLLRYDSSSGLLEYLVDGIPEAVTFTTDTRREEGTIMAPYVGSAGTGALEIGKNITGFLDEMRFSRRYIDQPALTRYGGRTGSAVSRIFDLNYSGTKIKKIESVYTRPGDSEVYFYYRASDSLEAEDRLSSTWQQFRPGEEFKNARGKYLQVMVELFPDGSRNHSPEVSELRIVYEPDLPPPPPGALYAQSGDGKVKLYWNRVNEEDVRGYLIYYGDAPGNYHGTDSSAGVSPIDVGDVSSFVVTGLENGKLYTFAVVAYDSTLPPHRSLFSGEVSSRPSRIFE